jgi:hypothetical protein
MNKGIIFLVVVFIISAAFSYNETDPFTPRVDNFAVSDIVIGQNGTIQVDYLIISAQTIAQNSNMIYKSGSGTILSYGMTGSLTGPSQGFQIFQGSTLTVEIKKCYTPQNIEE